MQKPCARVLVSCPSTLALNMSCATPVVSKLTGTAWKEVVSRSLKTGEVSDGARGLAAFGRKSRTQHPSTCTVANRVNYLLANQCLPCLTRTLLKAEKMLT